MVDIQSEDVIVGNGERAEELNNIDSDISNASDGHNHDGITSSLISIDSLNRSKFDLTSYTTAGGYTVINAAEEWIAPEGFLNVLIKSNTAATSINFYVYLKINGVWVTSYAVCNGTAGFFGCISTGDNIKIVASDNNTRILWNKVL